MTVVKVEGIGEVDVPDDCNLYVTIFDPENRSAVNINGGMMIWPSVPAGIATAKHLISMFAKDNAKAAKFTLGPILVKLPTVTHNGVSVEARLTSMQEIQALAKVLKEEHGFSILPGQEANAPTPCEVAINLLHAYRDALSKAEKRIKEATEGMLDANNELALVQGQGDIAG